MGQKVNPNGLRIHLTSEWSSQWFKTKKAYRETLIQDVSVRRYLITKLKEAGISRIDIDRGKRITITIHTAKPGIVIGKQGAAIEDLKKDLQSVYGVPMDVQVQEIRQPDADAKVIAETVQGQIERRMPYRRACKMAIEKAMASSGVQGVKIRVSGRLNGAEIARDEMFKDGNIPLQTLRADVSMAIAHAKTKSGTIGVKVWVYKGLVFKTVKQMQSNALTSLKDNTSSPSSHARA